MKNVLLALVIAALASVSASASDETDVMATVNRFVDGFNKGDTTMIVAACADQMSIIDEFPPHEWHGAGAIAKWVTDYDVDAKKNGISDGIVTLGKPQHIDVTAAYAYIVAPADYAFKRQGKPVKETGSIFTLTLQKGGAGWRITGWAWAKH